MSVELPPPLPPMHTVLGAIDAEGRRTAGAARDWTVAAVRRVLPARSGRQRQAARGRIFRTATGYRIDVKPSKSVRYDNGVTAVQVAGWLERGTGVFGPRHRPIRPRTAKAFHLPTGWRTTQLAGQRAQHPYARAQSSEQARVERILVAGATAAARAADRVLGGAL